MQWVRDGWDLYTTKTKYKRFDSLREALAFLRRLQMWERAQGTLRAKLEHRDDDGRWSEIPELARLWAEGGWND